MHATLQWADDLGLPSGAHVLDVGCGAGLLAAELSRRGFKVTATDSSSEMVTKAQQHMREVGIGDAVRIELADAHDLPYTSGEFDLIVAVGLLPWLHDWQRAIGELVRVLRPAGWLAVTA